MALRVGVSVTRTRRARPRKLARVERTNLSTMPSSAKLKPAARNASPMPMVVEWKAVVEREEGSSSKPFYQLDVNLHSESRPPPPPFATEVP